MVDPNLVEKPTVLIASPISGSEFQEGQDIHVQSISTDAKGITRVELDLDGIPIHVDTVASPQTRYNLVQTWKVMPGQHTLSVRAFNAANIPSDPAILVITGSPAVSQSIRRTAPAMPAPPTAPVVPPPVMPSTSAVRPNSSRSKFVLLGLGVLVLVAVAIALIVVFIPSLNPLAKSTSKPTVAITSPQNGTQFQEGQDVLIQSITANANVTRFELRVDDNVIRVDPVTLGQTNMSQTWKATPGTHKVSVRVFNSSDIASTPADIALVVAPVVAQVITPLVSPLGTPNVLTPTLGSQVVNPVVLPPLTPNILTPTLAPQTIVTPIPLAPALSPTPAITPPIITPSSSPTLAIAPDIYVTAIRTDPPVPTTGIPLAFNVTFLNTTNGNRGITWRLAIFKVGGPANSLGDTPIQNNDVSLGTHEIKSGTWQSPKECLQLFVNVFLVDSNSKQRLGPLFKIDRSGSFQFNFQTCP